MSFLKELFFWFPAATHGAFFFSHLLFLCFPEPSEEPPVFLGEALHQNRDSKAEYSVFFYIS